MKTCFLSLVRAYHKNASIKKSKEKKPIRLDLSDLCLNKRNNPIK